MVVSQDAARDECMPVDDEPSLRSWDSFHSLKSLVYENDSDFEHYQESDDEVGICSAANNDIEDLPSHSTAPDHLGSRKSEDLAKGSVRGSHEPNADEDRTKALPDSADEVVHRAPRHSGAAALPDPTAPSMLLKFRSLPPVTSTVEASLGEVNSLLPVTNFTPCQASKVCMLAADHIYSF